MPSILFEGGSIRNLTCTFVYGFVDQAERSQSPYELFSRANLSGLQNLRLEGGVVGCFNLGFTAFKALSSLTLNSSVLHPSAWAVLSQCSALKILEWRASEPETDSLPLHNYLPAAYGCDPPLLLELKKVTLQRAAAPLFFSAAITHNVDDVILRLPPRYFLDDIAAYLNDEVRYRIRRFQLYGISKLSEVDIAAILFLFPSLEELVSDSWSISSLCAVDALSQFDPDVDGHWHWRFPNIKRLTFGFGYTMEERKKKKDAAKMLRFEKRLTSKLLLVLNKLAAERAKAKTGSLRIHVRGIHLELPKPNGDDGYWSSVLVEDVAPSAGLENASLNIPESDSDSSDED
ncbi:hypothetical protein DL93DRAFT_2169861 [Clavulina sp. PMI_390]|nr:hypothetical protein DL93DRAFT_2169861 [Clavulina sp. PMI_390]